MYDSVDASAARIYVLWCSGGGRGSDIHRGICASGPSSRLLGSDVYRRARGRGLPALSPKRRHPVAGGAAHPSGRFGYRQDRCRGVHLGHSPRLQKQPSGLRPENRSGDSLSLPHLSSRGPDTVLSASFAAEAAHAASHLRLRHHQPLQGRRLLHVSVLSVPVSKVGEDAWNVFPRGLSACVREVFARMSVLDPELAHRTADWLSLHLSNLGFMWPWAKWKKVVDAPPYSAQKLFVQRVLQGLVDLSYRKLVQTVSDAPFQNLCSDVCLMAEPLSARVPRSVAT